MQNTTPSIQSSLQQTQSQNSMNQADVSQYKLSNNDNRKKDSNRYQKQIQLYNPQIKGRVIPKNVSEKASQIAAASKIAPREDLNSSNLNMTNQHIQDQNLSYCKQIGIEKDSNLRIGNFPITSQISRIHKIVNPHQVQSQKDNSHLKLNPQEKQQHASIHPQSQNYSYRSIQSANHITEEQSNQSISDQHPSGQKPTLNFYQNQQINKSGIQQNRKQLSIDNSINNKMNLTNNSFVQATPETQPSTTQLKSGGESVDISQIQNKQPDVKCEPFTDQKMKTKSDKYNFDDYCIEDVSDISASKIEYQGSKGQSLRQSTLLNSGSFNFNQPSFIYNEDVRSKNNSIYTNSQLGYLSQAAAGNKGQHRSSQTTTISNPDQKFIKSLIHKLHELNQSNQQNFSALDATLEGSILPQREEGVPNIVQSTTQTNNNNFVKNSESLFRSTRNSKITPIKKANRSMNISHHTINHSIDQINDVDKNQTLNLEANSPEQKQPKKITKIKNTSQKFITPLKAIHHKLSQSQCNNLQNISKSSIKQSLKLSCDNNNTLRHSSYEKDFNELQQTEFSCQNSQNSLNSIAGHRKNKMFFSFSQQPNQQFYSNNIKPNQNNNQLKQTNESQTPGEEISTNTARCQPGWMCC